jgi:hypothetical protein
MDPDAGIDVLRRQVGELADRQAITDLIFRIGTMLDAKRFEDAEVIFTPDVTVRTPGGSARGMEAVLGQARRNHAVVTQHIQTNLVISLDGDRATAHANLVAVYVPSPNPPAARLVVGARYRFVAARTAAGWRVTAMEIDPVWSTAPLPSGLAEAVDEPRGAQ